MDDKSGHPTPFYRSIGDSPEAPRDPSDGTAAGPPGGTADGAPDRTAERLESLPTTAGPWSPHAQHGGPPGALLARAVERLAAREARDAGPERVVERVVGRLTMELLGPVPVGPLEVGARVVRPGRSVQLVDAELVDPGKGRAVATARAWLFPATTTGPVPDAAPLPHSPADGAPHERPEGWHPGYLDAVEWRWISSGLDEPGAGVVWMRPPRLVEGEETTPLQRLMACVDSASGVSAALDIRAWAFLNTELTVHVLRPPVGEWICLDAETQLGSGSVGVCTSRVYDERGPVARSAQALLVTRR